MVLGTLLDQKGRAIDQVLAVRFTAPAGGFSPCQRWQEAPANCVPLPKTSGEYLHVGYPQYPVVDGSAPVTEEDRDILLQAAKMGKPWIYVGRALSRELFPTLGFPRIAAGTPCRRIFPLSKVARTRRAPFLWAQLAPAQPPERRYPYRLSPGRGWTNWRKLSRHCFDFPDTSSLFSDAEPLKNAGSQVLPQSAARQLTQGIDSPLCAG